MTRAADVDAAFVLSKRRMGAGWGAIARMAGCAEQDLRKHHDAAWVPAPGQVVEPVALPRDRVRKALRKRGLSPDHSMVLARMWLANGARRRSSELASGIAGGVAAQDICAEAKRAGAELGLRFVDGGTGFALTAESIVALSEMAGLRGRP